MTYSIRELSELAGVSARTLRYYDEIGLLKPMYASDAGYRFYGDSEVAVLQQILFYRERGFDLKQIRKIIYEEDFDIVRALEEHLMVLENQRKHVDSLIWTVKQTLGSMKGECEMKDREKFQAFKEGLIRENEEKYGKEIREKYGDDEVDASNRKMLNMFEEKWQQFKMLEEEIKAALKEAVLAGVSPDSAEARKIVDLHKEWLQMTLKQYSPEIHKGIAAMYVADERFKAYYDGDVAGCAELLANAVKVVYNEGS